MPNKLYVATANRGKLREIRQILSEFEVLGLCDLPISLDIEEEGKTFEQNSFKKARALYEVTGCAALGDDSGLCVNALSGAPGVYSARYSGEQGNDEANIKKLLADMEYVPDGDRAARFVCDMCFINSDGYEFHFVGICEGEILREKRGDGGFGYDPIFYLPDHKKTMAELSAEEKNSISHRYAALCGIRNRINL